MKVVILSAFEIRHKFLIGEINSKIRLEKVIVENSSIKAKFNTFHKFEKKRDNYEKKNFSLKKFNDVDKNKFFFANNINNKKVDLILNKICPEIIFVCGTRIISSKIVKRFKNKIFNFHGGDLENYRGLDSHMWAIYENKFNSIKTTLHRLKFLVDSGNVIYSNKLKIEKNTKLHELRYLNFKKASEQAIKLINLIERLGLNRFDRLAKKNINKDSNKKELFFYRVSKGDTLFSISKKFNIEIKTLVEMNRINGNKIYIGQELIIPNK